MKKQITPYFEIDSSFNGGYGDDQTLFVLKSTGVEACDFIHLDVDPQTNEFTLTIRGGLEINRFLSACAKFFILAQTDNN